MLCVRLRLLNCSAQNTHLATAGALPKVPCPYSKVPMPHGGRCLGKRGAEGIFFPICLFLSSASTACTKLRAGQLAHFPQSQALETRPSPKWKREGVLLQGKPFPRASPACFSPSPPNLHTPTKFNPQIVGGEKSQLTSKSHFALNNETYLHPWHSLWLVQSFYN